MTNEYREWYKKHHICENCGKEKAWKNTTMCPECLEKHKIRSEKTRSEESKEQRRKYVKRKRELCIAFGICRECMKRPVIKGKLKCIECYAKEKQRSKIIIVVLNFTAVKKLKSCGLQPSTQYFTYLLRFYKRWRKMTGHF